MISGFEAGMTRRDVTDAPVAIHNRHFAFFAVQVSIKGNGMFIAKHCP